MSLIQEFLEKFANKPSLPQLYAAEVVSVEETTCTIKVITGELEVPDVRLISDDTLGFYLKPKVGSRVMVGLIEGDMASLYVAQYSEIERLQFRVEDTEVLADAGGAMLQQKGASVFVLKDEIQLIQGQTEITIKGGKVTIKNAAIGMKDVFGDLFTLLNSFSVVSALPGSPTAGLNPATALLLNQWQAKFNQLLQ